MLLCCYAAPSSLYIMGVHMAICRVWAVDATDAADGNPLKPHQFRAQRDDALGADGGQHGGAVRDAGDTGEQEHGGLQ